MGRWNGQVKLYSHTTVSLAGAKKRALQVPPVAPYKALGNFPKALYGTTRGTSSARFFRPVIHYEMNARAGVPSCGKKSSNPRFQGK